MEIKHLHIEKELHTSPVAVLERYLEGELSAKDQEAVEAVLAEDPFMADALEGLRGMPDRARVQTAGHELRFKTRKLLRVRKPRRSFFQTTQYATAAVAVILVLFVASIAVYMTTHMAGGAKEEAVLAENRPAPLEAEDADQSLQPERAPEPEQTEEAAEAPTEPIAEEAEASPISPQPPSPQKEQAAPPEPAQQVEATVPVTGDPSLSDTQQQAYLQAFTQAEYQELLATLTTYDRHLQQQAEQEARARAQEKMAKRQETYDRQRPAPAAGASPPTSLQTGLWKTVIALMKKGEPAEAERLLKAELNNAPTEAIHWYQLGHFYLLNRQANKALPYLQAAARTPEPGIGYEARWQLSQAYLSLERNKEAEALLLEIADQPGKHQGHARAQLQKLSGAGE